MHFKLPIRWPVTVLILLVVISLPVFAQSTVNLTLDDGDMDEGFLGTGSFTVTRDGSTAESINVFVEVSGSATLNADYETTDFKGYIQPVWGVTIPAGQNSASVTLTPKKDNLNEGEEILAFTLQASVPGSGDYIMGDDVLAEMTLTDDVTKVILTLDDASMDEASQGTGSFIVTRDDHGDKSVAINVFVEVSGSATLNADYETTDFKGYIQPVWGVTIPAGQNSTNVILTAVRDYIIEGDETAIFTLQPSVAGSGDYIVGVQTLAEITILDLIDQVFMDSFEDR